MQDLPAGAEVQHQGNVRQSGRHRGDDVGEEEVSESDTAKGRDKNLPEAVGHLVSRRAVAARNARLNAVKDKKGYENNDK